MASVIRVRRPVFIAGRGNTWLELKLDAVVQPEQLWPQCCQGARPLMERVRTARRAGIQMMLSLSQAFLTSSSVQRGFGGGRNTPSGALEIFSLVPKTPM